MLLDSCSARLVLDLVPPTAITAEAVALVQAGHDHPTFRGLAAGAGATDAERLSLLRTGVLDLRKELPTVPQAVSILVMATSWDIHHGAVPPHAGARLLAGLRSRVERHSILNQYAELAGEWEATPSLRPEMDRRIEELARLVLAGSAS